MYVYNFITSGAWFDELPAEFKADMRLVAIHAAKNWAKPNKTLAREILKIIRDPQKWIDDGHDPKLIAQDVADKAPALHQYGAIKRQGYREWTWHTVNDDRVDKDCQERAGKVYPISEEFAPAHVNCRCSAHPWGKRYDEDDD